MEEVLELFYTSEDSWEPKDVERKKIMNEDFIDDELNSECILIWEHKFITNDFCSENNEYFESEYHHFIVKTKKENYIYLVNIKEFEFIYGSDPWFKKQKFYYLSKSIDVLVYYVMEKEIRDVYLTESLISSISS